MTDIIIRKETEQDYEQVHNLVYTAFSTAEHSDGDEHNLIQRLRQTSEYLPALALVATLDGKLIGHLMMSVCWIDNIEILALAPVSVLPNFQKMGIGSRLIREAHRIARNLGYSISVVLGSPQYYSNFGYETASKYNIYPPFEVPDEYFMIAILNNDTVIPSGTIKYSSAFRL